MTPETFCLVGLDPALALLPSKMDSPAARALLLAIAWQESRLKHRFQVGVKNGARGFHQWEPPKHGRVAIVGLLKHPSTAAHVRSLCKELEIEVTAAAIHEAVGYQDVLAVGMARLLLWTLPMRLPSRREPDFAWRQYESAWRPGRPHRATWDAFYDQAWTFVDGGSLPNSA